MKKLNLLFTALLLLCCVGTAKAEKVTINGIRYDVVTKAKVATVIAKETGKYSGSVVIPETIEHNGVNCSVTSIGDDAFNYCPGLTSVTIGNSVTSIGDDAFYYCPGLTSIVIPNSVTSIGEHAFYYCKGLTSVTIPNSVTSIGERAFSDCSGLREVHISDIAAWCRIDFAEYDANPLYYAKNLYLNGELVTELVIPEGVKEIKNYAFWYCSGLTSVEIPNSVTSIGDYAFYRCTGLTSVEILNGVTSIGRAAFLGCSGLTSFEIPNSVTRIEDSAFSGCSGLTGIEIPNSVTSIGDFVFNYCPGLTSVEIGNSVTSIGYEAFRSCTGLTSIVIPNSVTSIGGYAFEGCYGLTSVTIGSGVKKIDSKTFAKCSNLTDVYCLATSVPSTDATAFNESYPEYMTLHVPAEAINSYKTTAPWSSFGIIVTLDGEDYIEPEVKVCATPVISYSNGKIEIECETEGAEFITTVTNNYAKNYYSNNFELSATYDICVYAMATGYENSETVNTTLCWIECDCDADDTGIINIPAKAALVTLNGGVLSISCQLDGAEVAVYTTDGVLIATTTIENGAATVTTGLSKGSVAIVKIGNKSIKVIVD